MAKLSVKKPSRENISLGKKEALMEINKERIKKLNLNVPESLHYEFKKKCIEEKTNMSELIKQWIQKFINS